MSAEKIKPPKTIKCPYCQSPFIRYLMNNKKYFKCGSVSKLTKEGENIELIHRSKECDLRFKLYAIANNAIYFSDSSKYLGALAEICNAINPDMEYHGIECIFPSTELK